MYHLISRPRALTPRSGRGDQAPGQAELARSGQRPLQRRVGPPPRHQVDHHPPDPGAFAQRVDEQPREARAEEDRFVARRTCQVGANLVVDSLAVARVPRVVGRGGSLRGPFAGAQREEDALSRNRIDKTGGIAGEEPSRPRGGERTETGSGTRSSLQRWMVGRNSRGGNRHRYTARSTLPTTRPIKRTMASTSFMFILPPRTITYRPRFQ